MNYKKYYLFYSGINKVAYICAICKIHFAPFAHRAGAAQIEYLGIWETVYNPNFNYGEFAIIKSQAGLNSYKISVKEWVEKTNAIGLKATAGRYGGTYAHPEQETMAKFQQNKFDVSDESLNLFGKDGWELVGIYEKTETVHPNYGNDEYVTGLQPNVRTAEINFVFNAITRYC